MQVLKGSELPLALPVKVSKLPLQSVKAQDRNLKPEPQMVGSKGSLLELMV